MIYLTSEKLLQGKLVRGELAHWEVSTLLVEHCEGNFWSVQPEKQNSVYLKITIRKPG